MRLLVVDDAVFMREKMKLIVERYGYTVVAEASNGTEAVKKFMEFKPDIVTMDITMPEMDGISAIKEIKKKDANANIIVVSSLGQRDKVVDAFTAGAKKFIVKPFRDEIVIATLKSCMFKDTK